MADNVNYKCLRCGNEFSDEYSPDLIVEKSCPKCKSNSVRRLKTPASKQTETSANNK